MPCKLPAGVCLIIIGTEGRARSSVLRVRLQTGGDRKLHPQARALDV
jgi:hypothetical protein